MATLLCPYCETETSDEYNFCIACDKQVKCLNTECNKKLVPNKAFCFGCGQPLAPVELLQPQSNRYVRNVTQNGDNFQEHVEFMVSDHAVSQLAPFIAGHVTASPSQRIYDGQQIKPPTISPKALNSGTITQQDETIQPSQPAQEDTELPKIEPEELHTPATAASRYFERDGEFLVPTEKDFKGKTWTDQQRHFILLYASAYVDYFQKPVPSLEHFKTVSEKTKIYDASNYSKHVKKLANEHLTELSDGFKLNDRGNKEVGKILSLMADGNAPSGCEYWGRVQSASTPRYRMSKDVKERIQAWAGENVDLGNLDVRDIKYAVDYALVALWIITVKLNKTNAIRWNDAYFFFKEKYQAMAATPDAFSRAMKSDAGKKYFRQSDEMYYLTSDGIKKVEGWIGGEPVSTSGEET